MNLQDSCTSEFSRLLAEKIGPTRFRLWFADQTRIEWAGNTLKLGVPNRHFVEWLTERYGTQIREVAKTIAGQDAEVEIRIHQELFREMRSRQHVASTLTATPIPGPSLPGGFQGLPPELPQKKLSSSIGRLKNLADFYPGQSNRQAWLAAKAICQGLVPPGTFCFQGKCGLGKTHLLEGIGREFRVMAGGKRVLALSGEEFIQKFLLNIRTGKMAGWRRWMRSQDVLLLDDLGRLAGKSSTQEELLHILDHLQRSGGIFVASLDEGTATPDQRFLPELADRLSSGLKARLQMPDAQAKTAIFQKSMQNLEPVLCAEEVAEWVGRNIPGNPRSIQGAAHSLWLASRINGSPIDLDLAKTTLGHLAQIQIMPKRLEDIESAIVSVLGVSQDLLRNKSRDKRVTLPRYLAAYLARKHTSASASEIGNFLGGRSHSTILGCEKKVKSWLDSSSNHQDKPPGLDALVHRLEEILMDQSLQM